MRHQPALVDAVAREAAAEMIVDAALGDVSQRELDRRERIGETEAQPRAPQQIQELHLRKFRRAPDAAHHRIDRLHQAPRQVGQRRFVRRRRARPARARLEPVLQRVGVLPHLVLLVAIDPRHFIQYTDKCRTAVAFLAREIGAAPERLGVGGEEHGERPAALLAELVQRAHVDRVDIGALLAVDLDVDEQLVHHRRGGVVLEALMGHHVAPMAGGVADRQQDRLAARAGLGQGRLAPGAPMHRIVLVLQQIRAGLVAQPVTVYALLHGPSFARGLG